MIFKHSPKLAVVFCLFSLSWCVIAQTMHRDVLTKKNLKSERLQYTVNGKIHAVSGVYRYIFREHFISTKSTPEEKALDYLKHNASKLGMDKNLSHIRIKQTVKAPDGVHVFYQQHIQGIAVHGAWGSVVINNKGIVSYVTNNYKPDLHLGNFTAAIPASRAIMIAREYLQAGESIGSDSAALTIVESADSGAELSWKVLISSRKPLGTWRVFVNSVNGRIIDAADINLYATGKGMIFRPDPLTSAQQTYSPPYVDNNNSDVYELNQQRIEADLRDITYENGKYTLAGPHCIIADMTGNGSVFPEPTTPEGFKFTRSNIGFEAVMVYYYIDYLARRIKQFGYWNAALDQFKADPDGKHDMVFSAYWPASNFCEFSRTDGSPDAGEDATLILHEYGHAIQYNLTPGGFPDVTDSVSAVLEGTSDYWGGSYSRSVSEYRWGELFKWYWGDGQFCPVDPKQLRRCDTDLTFDDVATGAIGGQVWSSALMKINHDIGRDITDQLLLATHLRWGNRPTMRDAAMAFVSADTDLFGGKHLNSIIQNFKLHHLYVGNTIETIPFAVSGTNMQRDDSWDVQGLDGADEAYFIHLDQATSLDISVCSPFTTYDTKLEIFNADQSTTGYYNDDDYSNCPHGGLHSILRNVSLSAGDYYIVVDGYNGAEGNFELHVSYSNTNNPVIAALPYTHMGTTIDKSDDWDVQFGDGADMAYALSLNHGTRFTVSLCNNFTNYDTKLEIFNADQSTTTYYNDDDNQCFPNQLLSTLYNVYLNTGSYYVVVDGYNGVQGAYQITLDYAADHSAASLPYEYTGSTAGKTDGWDVQYGDGADEAFRINVPYAQSVKISLCNSVTAYDTKLEIFNDDGTTTGYYNDDCGNPVNNVSSEIPDAQLAAGEYFIVVDGFNGASGTYKLTIMQNAVSAPLAMSRGIQEEEYAVDTKKEKAKHACMHEMRKMGLTAVSLEGMDDFVAVSDYIYELEKKTGLLKNKRDLYQDHQ